MARPRMRDRIATLERENRELRERLAARAALDKTFTSTPGDSLAAVTKNLAWLSDLHKERVLLAAAVLYGVIKPTPQETPHV